MITETELRGKIVKMCSETSQAQAARELGVTRAYIHDIIAGRRRVSNRIAKQFGYRIASRHVPVERMYDVIGV